MNVKELDCKADGYHDVTSDVQAAISSAHLNCVAAADTTARSENITQDDLIAKGFDLDKLQDLN